MPDRAIIVLSPGSFLHVLELGWQRSKLEDGQGPHYSNLTGVEASAGHLQQSGLGAPAELRVSDLPSSRPATARPVCEIVPGLACVGLFCHSTRLLASLVVVQLNLLLEAYEELGRFQHQSLPPPLHVAPFSLRCATLCKLVDWYGSPVDDNDTVHSTVASAPSSSAQS
jgi:hypothetical protein